MSREGPPVERFVILPAQDPPLTLIGYTAGTRFLLNVAAVDELRVTIEENPNGMQLKVEGRALAPPLGRSPVQDELDVQEDARRAIQEGQELREVAHEAVGRDPWAGRSQGMRCATCIWYVPKKPSQPGLQDNALVQEVGRCRRHAPSMGGYPVVFPTDWCGDHRLDEGKL